MAESVKCVIKIGEVVVISRCTKTSPSFIEFKCKTRKKILMILFNGRFDRQGQVNSALGL